ncbi:hypothetical protein MTR67_051374 [Solanum verrucosum]|uniref:Uncharacterized protein n=1 Tax=Solanum verrucosum TaxID=315347 RepID=A0AAF0V6E2_SOLVR|nr:hypothetical protein MTR67_051374 [Solanum verrucosum]
MLLQITYHDKATQTETEEEDAIEKILKVITTLCTKVDSMDNEIQKLKTNEDNLKSKASQQHDYKNAELHRSEDGKNPELKGDDGKLLKTHNVCLNTAAVDPLYHQTLALFDEDDVNGLLLNNLGIYGLSNGRVGLKSEILKLIETEIGLGPDPLKFTVGSNGLGSNGLKNGLGLDPPNLTLLIQ